MSRGGGGLKEEEGVADGRKREGSWCKSGWRDEFTWPIRQKKGQRPPFCPSPSPSGTVWGARWHSGNQLMEVVEWLGGWSQGQREGEEAEEEKDSRSRRKMSRWKCSQAGIQSKYLEPLHLFYLCLFTRIFPLNPFNLVKIKSPQNWSKILQKILFKTSWQTSIFYSFLQNTDGKK